MVVMIPVAAVLVVAIGGPYSWLGYQHYSTFGGLNIAVQSVILFLCINTVICLWELCLFYKHALIRSTHTKRVKDGQVRIGRIVVFRWMHLSEVLSPSFWANIWIDYARFDEAYVQPLSAGFNIDVGNGHSTLLPTLFLLASMVRPMVDPKITGMVGLLVHYQMLYGTLLYFLAFFNTNGHRLLSKTETILAVVSPSLVWIVFPFVGMLGCARLIMDDDFSAWQETR